MKSETADAVPTEIHPVEQTTERSAPTLDGAAVDTSLPWVQLADRDTFGARADGLKLTFRLPRAPLRMRLQAFAELHELIGSWASSSTLESAS